MKGHRPSSLPVAQYCGLSPRLSQEAGAGRAAVRSSYFHALCEGDPKRISKARLLVTDEEAEEVSLGWARPGTVEVPGPDGTTLTLRYDDARKERHVALGENLQWCSPSKGEEPLTEGTLDFAWVVDSGDESVAYVADIKATQWSCEGPDSLQLLAYGYAFASQEVCRYFTPGIWIASEGRWWWSKRVYEPGSIDCWDVEMRLLHAALNRDERPSPGAHCRDCYGRMRCTAHVLPAAASETWLRAMAEGRAELTTPKQARDMLLALQASDDLSEKAWAYLKEYARRNGGIPDPDTGKVYRPIQVKGRESLDTKALKEAVGLEVVAKFTRQGSPFEQYRWLKDN